MQKLAGLYLPILLKQQVLSSSFPSFLFLMRLNKGYINVHSRPHQNIWLTIWAKIFSTGKLLPSYNHKVCMINHMDVDRENVIIAHDHGLLLGS